MKTFIQTAEKPRLAIRHDENSESPRSWGNIGYFFTKEGRYKSPDSNTHELYDIMLETGYEAKDTADHVRLIKERAHEAFMQSSPKDGNSHDENLRVIDIFPVCRIEHGNVIYRIGECAGFDYSNCGFYIVTARSLKGFRISTETEAKQIVEQELENYNHWVNGDVYAFTLYNEQGEEEDSCGGFYDLEDIKDNLTDEWKDENMQDYIV